MSHHPPLLTVDQVQRFLPSIHQLHQLDYGVGHGLISVHDLERTDSASLGVLLDSSGAADGWLDGQPPTGPCPSWCELEPGHLYESAERSGHIRAHTMRVGMLDTASGSRVYVDLDQEETRSEAGEAQVSPPAGSLSVEGGDLLSVHELESVSDMLARAALELRKIEAQQ